MPEIKLNKSTTYQKEIENKRKELKNISEQAADNIISVVRSTRLSKVELADLLQMIAQGYSYQRIIKKFKAKYDRTMSTTTINSYKTKYEGRISEIAKDMESLAIEKGLTKKFNRLKKEQELAEALEDEIFDEEGGLKTTNDKVLREYREILKLIAQEAGDINEGYQGDTMFINTSDDELKELVQNKLKSNKDLSVILAEAAGVRVATTK